jgi:glutamyl-tRNA synthetase
MSSPSSALPVGRLAPSPTGVLHLGNVRTILLAWLSIRSRGGRLLLRIEDIDGPRVRAGATEGTIEILEWLGFDWDGPIVRQSERLALYDEAAARLVAAGEVYACVCSRREVEEAGSAPHEGPGEPTADGPVYPGTCRGRFGSPEEARERTGRDPALRFRVDASAVPSVPFDDLFRGPLPGAISGDFVIRKRDGGPAYQLAVVVDDAAQEVTEVLRADDLLPSTPRQLLLYRALALREPRFAHVPLVVGADGRRLAKRHGDTSVLRYRAAGVSAERLIGAVAELAGLAPAGALRRPADLLDRFDLALVPRAPAIGDDLAL